MKYLKLFESKSFNNINESDLYTIILGPKYNVLLHNETYEGIIEVTNFVKDKWVDFTNDEVDEIKELYPKLAIGLEYDYKCHPFNQRALKNTLVIRSSDDHIIDNKINMIYKLKDEWYYVTSITFKSSKPLKESHYKCDQWDGLLSCLKEVLI